MQRLIVNADDFGLTKGINKGIVKGFLQGIVTNATALVNMPRWEHAAGLVGKYPGLGIGLHFNLTMGSPVTAPERIPSLVNGEGGFTEDRDALAAAEPREIALELSSQFARLVQAGVKPTHISSHQNIHSIDKVLTVVLDFATRRGLPVRLVPQARTRYADTGAMTTRALIVQFWDKGANRPNFERLLSTCQAETVELQCHPGVVDADLEGLSPYTWQRERELAVVCAYDKEGFPRHFGWELISYSSLKSLERGDMV